MATVGALVVLAVAATVLLRLESRRTVLFAARTAGAPVAAAPAAETKKQTSSPAPQAATVQESRGGADLKMPPAAQVRPVPARLPGIPEASSRSAPADTGQPAVVADASPRPSAPPPSPPAPAMTEDTLGGVAQPRLERRNIVAPGSAAAAQAENANNREPQGKAVRAPQPEIALAQAYSGAPARAGKAVPRELGAGAQWTIAPDGRLQRAIAGPSGEVWGNVAVEAGVVFRAVSASKSDVWAGGSAGSLFHSTDAGANWTRVAPQSGERRLEGDIISIRVTGPNDQIVRVKTSLGQNWISADGGLTWRLETLANH
ncbi:MAG: hypothetical protein JO041_13475 [Acidobacteria bacterium]|nr:hypothetical protein [Acidobacteriota bacterium]